MKNLEDLTPQQLGMPLEKVTYKVPSKSVRQAMRHKFTQDIRPRFIQHLVQNCRDQLFAAGVTEKEFAVMRDQGLVPPRFNVHHKLPIHGGGTNDFSNLILIDLASHQVIHDYIDPQIMTRDRRGHQMMITEGQSRDIRLPAPQGNVFQVPPALKDRMIRTARGVHGQEIEPPATPQADAARERGNRLSGQWRTVHTVGPDSESGPSTNWKADLAAFQKRQEEERRLTEQRPGGRRP